MTVEEAIELIESTPIMRMERAAGKPSSELGEAMCMAVDALRDKAERLDDMK